MIISVFTLGFMLTSKILELRTKDKRKHAEFLFGGWIIPLNIIFSRSIRLPAIFMISLWLTAQ